MDGQGIIKEMQEACEYDPEDDGSVDDLIDYKNALEDFVTSLPVKAIESILAYSFPDEQADYEREGQPEHHVFRDLLAIDEWLDLHVRPASSPSSTGRRRA